MTAGDNGAARLPEPFGAGIDRDRPIHFTFDGRRVTAFEGDTIASALLANGLHLIARSFKYHRPRSILGLGGSDANALVTVDGAANVLSAQTPVRPGMVVSAQNYRGSLQHDRWFVPYWFHRFLPVGFYYWTFFRPAFLWRFWENVIRRRAGLGRVDRHSGHVWPDHGYLFVDVAVVGAGPAGLAAAHAAAEAGATVALLDARPASGGAAHWSRLGDAAARLARLAQTVIEHPNVTWMPDTRCTGVYDDNMIAAESAGRLFRIRSARTVMATGGLEQLAVFRRNDLPGIMFAGAVQELIRRFGVRPGRRAIVLTTNDHGYEVAADLRDAGVDVAAIIDARAAPVRDSDFPCLAGALVAEAYGRRHIRGVRAGPSDDPFRGSRRIACDLLVLATAQAPAGALWCQAGGRLTFDPETANLVLDGQPSRMAAAGFANGATCFDAAVADGAAAGNGAAGAAGMAPAQPGDSAHARDDRAPDAPLPIVPHPKGQDFVDLDEDLTVQDLDDAIAQGFDHAQLLKRYSTLGMGPSQGKHALLAGVIISAGARGLPEAAVGRTTIRPPASGLRFDTLAGRNFHPERRTPMHDQHVAAGAEMMPAGVWWRPVLYRNGGPAPSRQAMLDLAREEARHVRDAAGMIDVSTLGKLEVRGPDAAAFLERVYTFRYAKQPVGRTRYLLMTDEAGYIIDDGVACRLGEDHFYVTTTTGASDQVFRTMLFWNAQWRMAVDIANVTGAMAAVNVAGPLSRQLLEPISDIDLSGDAFPYLAARTGDIAGIPARAMRVGFVGELGYEIHVRAGYGAALWHALDAAGKRYDLRQFGVEAQRLLRLEKGHVIVGQDTDGLTHPAEVGMRWAVADKPSFVGDRAIAIHESRPPQRQLVGFTAPRAIGLMPEENHLVVRDGEIAGRVTSVGLNTRDGEIIGLAFVAPDQSRPGTRIDIKVDGRLLAAEVAELPFYDPDNARQDIA